MRATPSAEPARARGPVPRIGRVLDGVGLTLFVAGVCLFVWSWVGFGRVPQYRPGLEQGPWAAVLLADGYWRLQKIGATLMSAGVAVFVCAWWVAGRIRRQAED